MNDEDDDYAKDEDSAVHRAQAPTDEFIHTTTGEEVDEHLAALGITIRESRGIESVMLKFPGMDEFEISTHEIHKWLEQTGLIRTARQWSELDDLVQQAIERAQGAVVPQRPRPPGAGEGYYDWEEWAQLREHSRTDPERYAIDDEQTVAWNRMLNAWERFRQQVEQVQAAAPAEEGEPVVRAVGDAITALNMIHNDSWASPFTEEFGEWMGLDATAFSGHSFRDAAADVVTAGWDLYSQWQAAVADGNYQSHQLAYPELDFVKACEEARSTLVPKEAEPAG